MNLCNFKPCSAQKESNFGKQSSKKEKETIKNYGEVQKKKKKKQKQLTKEKAETSERNNNTPKLKALPVVSICLYSIVL